MAEALLSRRLRPSTSAISSEPAPTLRSHPVTFRLSDRVARQSGLRARRCQLWQSLSYGG